VVNPDDDGATALENVVSIGFKRLDFLLPMSNWDSYNEQSALRCGLYLVNAFRAWLRLGDPEIYVKLFHSMIKLVTGQVAGCCMFHNSCDSILTVEPNGDIALCDDLKPVGEHVYLTGLNITRDNLPSIRKELNARFREYSINSARPTQELGDVAKNWCPATRYSNGAGFTKHSVDSIPIGMLQSEVVRSLEVIGMEQFQLHPQMMTLQ
jgi:sulfatase maturation enzyme AslB (radical SAM superfamily)